MTTVKRRSAPETHRKKVGHRAVPAVVGAIVVPTRRPGARRLCLWCPLLAAVVFLARLALRFVLGLAAAAATPAAGLGCGLAFAFFARRLAASPQRDLRAGQLLHLFYRPAGRRVNQLIST